MTVYTDQDYEDLKYALGVLGFSSYKSLEDVPDTDITLAIGKSNAEVLTTPHQIKSWLRIDRVEGEVRWYGIHEDYWKEIEWYLTIKPDAQHPAVDIDREVLFLKGVEFIRHILTDLGGSNYNKPPIFAMLSNPERNKQYRAAAVWISRDTGALALTGMSAAPVSYDASREWTFEPTLFWFEIVSPNMVTLVLRRLSRPVQEGTSDADPQPKEEGEGQQEVSA